MPHPADLIDTHIVRARVSGYRTPTGGYCYCAGRCDRRRRGVDRGRAERRGHPRVRRHDPQQPDHELGQYPIPTQAPAYVNSGDDLPAVNGTLGNPVSMFTEGDTATPIDSTQVVNIPGGSTSWGTPTRTDASLAGPSQA